jgi:hypothetical protein
LAKLAQDRDAHGEVEPVEEVLGARVQVQREIVYGAAAVGEEGDLLVGGHTLGPQQLIQLAFGLAVVGLGEPEAAGLSLGGHGLGGDHL